MNQPQNAVNTQPLRDLADTILRDLEVTERRSWGYESERTQGLENALQIKLESYRKLLDIQLAILSGADDLQALLLKALMPATAPPAPVEEVDDLPTVPCEYCDGEGSSHVKFDDFDMQGRVPCVACDGSGRVPVDEGSQNV